MIQEDTKLLRKFRFEMEKIKHVDKYDNSPLYRAFQIVNNRSEEQERRHGPFSDGMRKAAVIASEMTGKNITTEDCYKVLIALKLSRIAHSPELDSFTDLCGYTEGLWNYLQEQKKQFPEFPPIKPSSIK